MTITVSRDHEEVESSAPAKTVASERAGSFIHQYKTWDPGGKSA